MPGKKSLSLLFALAVLAVAATAEARHVRFLGPHPIAAQYGGGYCYIEAPHLHVYPPDHPSLYQRVNDQYVFAGDPTPFGYQGDQYKYYGHHPIQTVTGETVYCLIDGPHFHPFAPPEGPQYRVEDDVAFYVAPLPEAYVRVAPQRVRVNAEYAPYAAMRPVVDVRPPPEWHGEVYVPPLPPPADSVPMPPPPPGVVVAPPMPPQPPHAASPVMPPPPPGVVVAPPPPPHPGVPVVVAPPPPPHAVVPVPVVAPPPPPHAVVVAPVPPRPFVPVPVAPPRPPGIVVGVPGVPGVPVPGVVVGGHVHSEHCEHHDNGVRAWGAPGRKKGHWK